MGYFLLEVGTEASLWIQDCLSNSVSCCGVANEEHVLSLKEQWKQINAIPVIENWKTSISIRQTDMGRMVDAITAMKSLNTLSKILRNLIYF